MGQPHLYCQYQSLAVHVELGVPQSMLSVGRMPEVMASSCLMDGSWQPSCSCTTAQPHCKEAMLRVPC